MLPCDGDTYFRPEDVEQLEQKYIPNCQTKVIFFFFFFFFFFLIIPSSHSPYFIKKSNNQTNKIK